MSRNGPWKENGASDSSRPKSSANTEAPSQSSQQQGNSSEILDHARLLTSFTELVKYANQFPFDQKEFLPMQEQDKRQKKEIRRLKHELDTIHTYQEDQFGRLIQQIEENRALIAGFQDREAEMEAMKRRLEDERENLDTRVQTEKQQYKEEQEERTKAHKEKLKKQALDKIEEVKEAGRKERESRDMKILQLTNELKEKEEAWELDRSRLMEEVTTLRGNNRSNLDRITKLENYQQTLEVVQGLVEHPLEFYASRFTMLKDMISGIATSLELTGNSVDRESVFQDCGDHAILDHVSFNSEGPASTFVRQCAMQGVISNIIFTAIQRTYLVDAEGSEAPQMALLEHLGRVPNASSHQELIWRLTLQKKLEHLDAASAEPTDSATRKQLILKKLKLKIKYFEKSDQVEAALVQLADLGVDLWTALRYDKWQIEADFSPPIDTMLGDDGWEWTEMSLNSPRLLAHVDSIPNSPPWALFPRLRIQSLRATAADLNAPLHPTKTLIAGLALPKNSSAIAASHDEDDEVVQSMKAMRKGRGSMSQVSLPFAQLPHGFLRSNVAVQNA